MFSYTKLMQAMVAAGAVSANDPYFNLVTLLLPGNGTNGAQNNTFLDSSSNNFTITRNGNTTQGTFSPFSQTGWSNYGDLTGNGYLSLADNAAWDISANYTIEAWFYVTGNSSTNPSSDKYWGIVSQFQDYNNLWSLGYIGDGSSSGEGLQFQTIIGGTNVVTKYTASISKNTWHHVAVTYTGSVRYLYLDGTQVASTSISSSTSNSGSLFIGRLNGGADGYQGQYNGYISNVRIVKGSVVYTGSSFSVPTAPLTAITNTVLLTCQSNRFVDNSSNAFAITVNGTPSIQAFSPFAPTAAYDAATVGGSGYFDGNGDYLGLPNNSAFTFNSDFTIESWIYLPAYPSGDAFIATGNVPGSWGFSCNSSGQLSCDDRGSGYLNSGSTLLPKNAWTHVAWSHVGTTTSDALYINGIRVATGSGRSFSNTVTAPTVGSSSGGNFPFPGYISNLRILKGTALYSGASFTVPTSLLTNITNTSLLLNFANAGITDATAKNVLETVGNAQISTTQSKFGGSSMYFDGTGDRLKIPYNPNLLFLSGDFTVEMWVYKSANNAYMTACGNLASAATAAWSIIGDATGNKITWYSNSAFVLESTTSLATSTWYHVAVARSGTTIRLFINGTQEASATNSTNYNVTNDVIVGQDNQLISARDWNGYIDDLRITKGYARYTANFTAPTAAFQLS